MGTFFSRISQYREVKKRPRHVCVAHSSCSRSPAHLQSFSLMPEEVHVRQPSWLLAPPLWAGSRMVDSCPATLTVLDHETWQKLESLTPRGTFGFPALRLSFTYPASQLSDDASSVAAWEVSSAALDFPQPCLEHLMLDETAAC